MRLLVCAGMTGGGVYPALAVLQSMKNRIEGVLWVGSKGGMEAELLKPFNLRFAAVSAAGLHGVGLRALPGNAAQLFRGWLEAKSIIKKYKPDVMFFTGGYLGVPVAFAGRQIPSVVFVPDIEPGLALKTILRFAEKVAVSTPTAGQFVHHKDFHHTGYPIRQELLQWNRGRGRKHFGIDEKSKVLLVFGGSKGAMSINQALSGILEKLLPEAHIIHLCGKNHWESTKSDLEALPKNLQSRYHAYAYLNDEMGAAFAAADLCVCRAGASTLGELPFFGLPAILVPYPYAWRYQHQNAEYLRDLGGAVILEDKELSTRLLPTVIELLNNTNQLKKMKSAIIEHARPDAAQRISELILQAGTASRTKEATYG